MTSSKFLNGTKIIFEASSNSQGPCRSPANAHRKTAASQDLNNSDLLSLMQIFSSSLKQLNFRFHPRHVPKQNPTNWWCLELQGEFAFYSRPRNCPSFSFLVNISALVWARESCQSAIICERFKRDCAFKQDLGIPAPAD